MYKERKKFELSLATRFVSQPVNGSVLISFICLTRSPDFKDISPGSGKVFGTFLKVCNQPFSSKKTSCIMIFV